jgi:proton glutamate symport protein
VGQGGPGGLKPAVGGPRRSGTGGYVGVMGPSDLGRRLRSALARIAGRSRRERDRADHGFGPGVPEGADEPAVGDAAAPTRLADIVERTRTELGELSGRLQDLELVRVGPRLGELTAELRTLLRARMWLRVLIAAVLGVGTGLVLSPDGAGVLDQGLVAEVAGYLGLPGDVFLALLEMIVVPLVVSSIMLGVSSAGDVETLRRVGWRTVAYFVGTTSVAISIGALVALVIRPGDRLDPDVAAGLESVAVPTTTDEPPAELADRIVSLIPSDPLGAALDQNLLQLVIFAVLIGVALLTIAPRHAQPLTVLAGAVQEISLKVVSWAMYVAPLAVFGLMAKLMLEIGFDALAGTAAYVVTVLVGLSAMCGVYLVLAAVVGRCSPRRFLGAAREAQLLAFSTSSSASVMPVTMSAAQEQLGVRAATTRFVVPLGATINMDGTALYQVAATLFVVQFYDVDVSVAELLVLAVTVVGASIGTPSTPGVGIVVLGTILAGVGVPVGGIALIVGVDRILDMSRTVVNVTGDLAACLVLDRLVGERLGEPDSGELEPNEPGSDGSE